MRIAITLAATLALAAAPVLAAPSLRSVMHSWAGHARTIEFMLNGRTAYNEAAIRAALQDYAAKAGAVAARVNGRTASAQNFKRRLIAFQADAQSALGAVPQRPALKTAASRLFADCQSCHNVFRN